MTRPPLPPFRRKHRHHEGPHGRGWLEQAANPEKVALAYTPDCQWRNRAEIFRGRERIIEFLTRKWARELDYRLIKDLWACHGNRIAVRFAYEYRDDSGSWFRAYGNENWEFAENGLMRQRIASINDLPISEQERLFHWPLGHRPDNHPACRPLACRSGVMPLGVADIAFTPTVRAEQERLGSATLYESALSPERDGGRHLTEREVTFLEARDGVFQATASETGWPYVQFRGGAPGFFRVIDPANRRLRRLPRQSAVYQHRQPAHQSPRRDYRDRLPGAQAPQAVGHGHEISENAGVMGPALHARCAAGRARDHHSCRSL